MAENRVEVTLVCSVCGNENYISTKNKKNNPDRLQINKYCPHCHKKTLHKEKR